ncbi:hypothetical protein ACYULU_02710 [Breznakiellaceae bacterium SP9]
MNHVDSFPLCETLRFLFLFLVLLYKELSSNSRSTSYLVAKLDLHRDKEEINHKVHQEHEGGKRKKLLPFVPFVVDFSSFLFYGSRLGREEGIGNRAMSTS